MSETTGGHVFVVHGKIEELAHDAAIVPVDRRLRFNDYWRPLLGSPWPSKPRTWRSGWGRVDERNQWLVMVGDGDYDEVLKRLTRVADDVLAVSPRPFGGRARALVALPVVGIGLGGHAHEQGLVVRKLLRHLTDLARDRPLDFALVTPEASVFAAAQYVRRQSDSALGAEMERLAEQLGHLARSNQLALFIGAGASIPAGLKSWTDLISTLSDNVAGASGDAFRALGPTDQAELIEIADPEGFKARVAALVRPAKRPALIHVLLAGLDVGQAVTTNYDLLYESAVRATGREIDSVMPWASAVGADRWVLKMHGDVEHEKQIVLTRRHMVRYDAANRPSGALLQSLLLTKHLLVVGASLSDDNVIRLAHEVQAYREDHQAPRGRDDEAGSARMAAFGTVLDASPFGDEMRARLWHGQLEWFHLNRVMEESPSRALELLLDRAGAHATQDSSWLLDPRFAGMLEADADRDLAVRARELLAAAQDRDLATWGPLVEALRRLGAQGGDHPRSRLSTQSSRIERAGLRSRVRRHRR